VRTAPVGPSTGERTVEHMRDGALPAAVVAAAVIAFVAYISFQGASHAVDYAVTSSGASVLATDSPRVPSGWGHSGGHVLVVQVSWHAGEDIAAGSYAVMVAPPTGWRRAGCLPECEWTDAEGLSEFRRRLAGRPYPLAATFEAEENGAVRVAFSSPPGSPGVPAGYAPVGWLVQTNGDDVLGAAQIPLELRGAT
jgi:hypothetical protein